MVAEAAEPADRRIAAPGTAAAAVRLGEIREEGLDRVPLPIEEFARVLGGGIVPGSIVLIGGDPGIGKSTLLLQVALALAERQRVLRLRGNRSGRSRAGPTVSEPARAIALMAETELEECCGRSSRSNPRWP
jgi:DNA repair protein RadA/Sms